MDSYGRKNELGGRPVQLISVARLLIHVEGQTEEDFVNAVLRSTTQYPKVTIPWTRELWATPVYASGVVASALGLCVGRDIINHLREDQDCIATTMVD